MTDADDIVLEALLDDVLDPVDGARRSMATTALGLMTPEPIDARQPSTPNWRRWIRNASGCVTAIAAGGELEGLARARFRRANASAD